MINKLIILNKPKRYISNGQAVNERIIIVNLNLKSYKTTIIGTYARMTTMHDYKKETNVYEILDEITSQTRQTIYTRGPRRKNRQNHEWLLQTYGEIYTYIWA